MNPLVSVLLPVRNAAASLPAALDSLCAQSLGAFEILAVDDGSDDGGATRAVLAAYAGKDRRIRPVCTPHQGIAHALNLAVEHACGRFLARMDADDFSHPDRLRLQASHLLENSETDVVSCLVAFGGGPQAAGYARHVEWINTRLTHAQMALGVFREAPVAHPSVMFRASAFQRLGRYRQGHFPEDDDLWLRWLSAGARFAKLPQTLLIWNDPPDRLSRRDARYDPETFHALKAGHLAAWLAANNPFHPSIYVVGAGRITRRRAEHLIGHGVRIEAYLDIDPRKVGRVIQGRPVLFHEAVPEAGRCFVVSYVAGHGAAEQVEAFLLSRSFVPAQGYILAG